MGGAGDGTGAAAGPGEGPLRERALPALPPAGRGVRLCGADAAAAAVHLRAQPDRAAHAALGRRAGGPVPHPQARPLQPPLELLHSES